MKDRAKDLIWQLRNTHGLGETADLFDKTRKERDILIEEADVMDAELQDLRAENKELNKELSDTHKHYQGEMND